MSHHRKLIAQCLAILLALPLLYVTSSGPMLRLSTRIPAVEWKACKFYEPLFRLTHHPTLGRPIITYLQLWNVTPVDVDVGDQITRWGILTLRP